MQRRKQEDKIRHGKRKKNKSKGRKEIRARERTREPRFRANFREKRDGQTATEQDG